MSRVLTCNRYLSEIGADIIAELERKRNLRLICGAGIGKTYFILNDFAKHYDRQDKHPLLIDFLNSMVTNQQAESGGKFDRLTQRNISLNGGKLVKPSICNVALFDAPIDYGLMLSSVSAVVLDEEHLIGESATFRHETISNLFAFVDAVQCLGIPLLTMTATPINEHFKCTDIRVKATDRQAVQAVQYHFRKGLSSSNCHKLVENIFDHDPNAKVFIMANSVAKEKIYKNLVAMYGELSVRWISSKQQDDTNGTTSYILKNSETDNAKVYVSTKFICEGININDDNNNIYLVTFANEMDSGAKVIQFCHRLRKQRRVILIGYKDDKQFQYKPKSEIFAKGERDAIVKDEFSNYTLDCATLFANKQCWKDYLIEYTENCEGITDKDFKIKNKGGRPHGANDAKGLAMALKSLKQIVTSCKYNGIRFDIFTTDNKADFLACANDNYIIRAEHPRRAEYLLKMYECGIIPDDKRGDKELKDLTDIFRICSIYYKFNLYNRIHENGRPIFPNELRLNEVTDIQQQKNRLKNVGIRYHTQMEILLENDAEQLQTLLDEYQTQAENLYIRAFIQTDIEPATFWNCWSWHGTESQTSTERSRKARAKAKEGKTKSKPMTNYERLKKYRESKKSKKIE